MQQISKLFNENNKKFIFYALSHNSNPDIFLTVCATKNQAIEYLDTTLKQRYWSHFQAWCILHDRAISDICSWQEYAVECIPTQEKADYTIFKIMYRKSDIAAILRMFGDCVPIGCSFDTQLENEYQRSRSELNDFENQRAESPKSIDMENS